MNEKINSLYPLLPVASHCQRIVRHMAYQGGILRALLHTYCMGDIQVLLPHHHMMSPSVTRLQPRVACLGAKSAKICTGSKDVIRERCEQGTRTRPLDHPRKSHTLAGTGCSGIRHLGLYVQLEAGGLVQYSGSIESSSCQLPSPGLDTSAYHASRAKNS